MTSKKQLEAKILEEQQRVTDLKVGIGQLARKLQTLTGKVSMLETDMGKHHPPEPEPQKRVVIRWGDPGTDMVINLEDGERPPMVGEQAWGYTDKYDVHHVVNLATAIEVTVTELDSGR